MSVHYNIYISYVLGRYKWLLASASMYLILCLWMVTQTMNNKLLLNGQKFLLPMLDAVVTIFYIFFFILDLYTGISEVGVF